MRKFRTGRITRVDGLFLKDIWVFNKDEQLIGRKGRNLGRQIIQDKESLVELLPVSVHYQRAGIWWKTWKGSESQDQLGEKTVTKYIGMLDRNRNRSSARYKWMPKKIGRLGTIQCVAYWIERLASVESTSDSWSAALHKYMVIRTAASSLALETSTGGMS